MIGDLLGDLTWLGVAVLWVAFAVVFVSGCWVGLAAGYRMKLREASHLEFPDRPWWARVRRRPDRVTWLSSGRPMNGWVPPACPPNVPRRSPKRPDPADSPSAGG